MAEEKVKEKRFIVEVIDDQGKKIQVFADDLFNIICKSCGQSFFVANNIGDLKCPHCSSDDLRCAWGQIKAGFVTESDYYAVNSDLDQTPGRK